MSQIRNVALLWAVLVPGVALGDDVESLHSANVNFEFKRGWTFQAHTRLRTFENLGAYNQFRMGPVVLWQAAPRWQLLSGYYYIEQNRRQTHVPYSLHRVFAGTQYKVAQGEQWALEARIAAERFISTGFSDYWRSRNRLMLNWKTKIGDPYLSGEAFAQQGVWYGRTTAGMQWKVHARVTLGAGYEYRQARNGPGSHVIATIIQWTAYRAPQPYVD